MATLHRFCCDLLPLPPFEVWSTDYEAFRLAHRKDSAAFPQAGEPSEPVTVELRAVNYDGGDWHASLDVFRDGDYWRGYVRFRRDPGEPQVRTADIFCEEELPDLRDRFRSFTWDTLVAFLRSALP